MDNAKERLETLNKIGRTARLARHGSTPAAPRIFTGVIVGSVIGGVLEATVFPAHGLLLALAFLVGGIAGYRCAANKTWEEIIFDQLTNYQPLNESAYRLIQELASEKKLGYDDILQWVAEEREYIEPRQPSSAELARKRFTAKQPE